MGDRFPGGVISKTPPTVVAPVDGEGGSASGVWTLAEQLGLQKAGNWPGRVLPRELYSWGSNSDGRLGTNDTNERSSPVQVGALTTWSQVSAGDKHSHAVRSDGTLWSWGEAGDGRLATGNTIDRSSPVQVGFLTNWAQVAAGNVNGGAVKTDGTLWTWGNNYFGTMGDGSGGAFTDKSSPVQIGALTTWYQVSVGGRHMLALKTDGTLWAWGRNVNNYGDGGQLGDGTTNSRSSPVQIGALTNWSQVSAGGYFSASVKTDGTLWMWGVNSSYGQLGVNDRSNRNSPVQVGGLTNWSRVSASKASGGAEHTLAVKTAGTLWAWGRNTAGSLGLSNTINRSSPVQVGALAAWLKVSAGGQTSHAIKIDGTLWGWGANSGRVGNETSPNISSPVQIGSDTNWFEIELGSSHALAITKG